jgi:hypothetical protein
MMNVVNIGDKIAIHSTPLITFKEITKIPHHNTTSPKKFGCLLIFHSPKKKIKQNGKYIWRWNVILNFIVKTKLHREIR